MVIEIIGAMSSGGTERSAQKKHAPGTHGAGEIVRKPLKLKAARVERKKGRAGEVVQREHEERDEARIAQVKGIKVRSGGDGVGGQTEGFQVGGPKNSGT